MKIGIEAKILLLILILAFAGVFLTQFWHSSPQVVISNAAISLEKYPKVVYSDQNACFSIEFLLPSNNLRASLNLEARSGEQLLVSENEQVHTGKYSFTREYCFSANKLKEGKSIIDITSSTNNIFFNIEKKQGSEPEKPEASLAIGSLDNGILEFFVSNFDNEKIAPIEIFVNGNLDHRVFPGQKDQSFREKISLQNGKNLVELKLGNQAVAKELVHDANPVIPFFLGIIIFIISFAVFVLFVFSKSGLIEKFALSFASVFALILLLGFVLGHLQLLSIYSFFGCLFAILLLIAFFFRKNLSQSFPKINIFQANIIVVFAIAFFFLSPLFFQFFTSTHITYWNGFYERSSSAIAQSFSVPITDPLGYFGRGFSAVPGYFFLDAGISWITGLAGTQLFSILLLISSIFLFLCGMFFCDALKLSDGKKALFIIFLGLEGFLASAMAYSPRHVFAFGFFLLALAILIKKKNFLWAGLFLGIMDFIQAPLLLFFPLFYLIVTPKIELKKIIYSTILGGLVFLVLFLPNILQFGILRQAQSEEWGYLINYTPYYLLIDIIMLGLFFLLFYGPDLLRRKIPLDFYSKKLLLGLVFGIALQLTVIYRWNLMTTVNLALLIAVFFPEKSLLDRVSSRLLAIVLLIATGFVLYSMVFINVHEIVIQPSEYLAKNTETNAKILTDPMYGHIIPFVANRAVLADLQVEYADEQKLLDTYNFLEDKNYAVISKYGIDYTVNQVDFVHRSAIGEQKTYGIIEFKKFDKIFSNGFIFIHRVGKENIETQPVLP